MSAPILAALTILVAGAALRPRPPTRTPDDSPPEPRPLVRRRRAVPVRAVRPDPLELAAWCDAMARELRSGTALRRAITEVAPPASAHAAFEPIRHALERGASLSEALSTPPAPADPPPHVDLVLVMLRACAQHGGPAAEPVDRCAAALRQRAALIAERATSSAQARLSALVMTLLPVVLLGVLLLSSGPVRHAALSPIGLVVLALGGACNAAGWAWMRRLIRGGAPW